ncbi:MAG: DUF6691 family protein [Pseudomonadales bacterium]
MRYFIYLLSGVLFAAGLQISQMVDPAKVIGFLDITGRWDPSLVLVLCSALGTFSAGYHFVVKPRLARQQAPVCEREFSLPKAKTIDASLLVGAAIFGLGWSISGLCPGPALANLASGEAKIVLFVTMMLLGMALAKMWSKLILSS